MRQLTFLKQGTLFIRRQQRDWKVTVARTSFDKLVYQMVFPYLSIYIVALGANATQLGMVTSIGMVVAGLIAPFTGWLIDRIGPKRIYLFGIGMLAVSYLTYALAQNWAVTILAMVAFWLGNSVSIHSCSAVCGTCLANEDRATGMTFCETVASGLLGMAGPIIGAFVIAILGGMSVENMRPLFSLALLITIGSFFFVLSQLTDRRWSTPQRAQPNVLRDLHQVVSGGRYLKRWLVIAGVGGLPLGMVFPYSQVFAHQIKGADEITLGAIVTGTAIASIAFAVPLGRLADRVGRKRILFVTIPVFWAANIILVSAPNAAFLMLAGIMLGFYYIGAPISAAMERELVPAEQMGRWIGIARMCRMIFNAALTFASGIIWDWVGPQYVFLSFVAIDLLIRVPLLINMPETLRMRVGQAPVQAAGQAK